MNVLIYTCIICRRDELPEAIIRHGSETYECYSDDPGYYQDRGWDCYSLYHLETSPVRTCRWHKTHPHFLAPKFDFYVWLDGHIVPKVDLSKLLKNMKGDIAAFPHRHRTDPYQEVNRVHKLGLDFGNECKKAKRLLHEESYPRDGGLHETGILLMKNSSTVRNFLVQWWGDIGTRDQLHFDRLVRSQGIKLENLPGNVKENELFEWFPHKHPPSPATLRLQEQWTGKILPGRF